MPTYKVKPGYKHGASNQYEAGDTVEMTEQEAAGFLDKLELVGGGKSKTAVKTATNNPVRLDSLSLDADTMTALETAGYVYVTDLPEKDSDLETVKGITAARLKAIRKVANTN